MRARSLSGLVSPLAGLAMLAAGCGSPSFCEPALGAGPLTVALQPASGRPVRVSWDDTQARASRVHGAFALAGDDPERAVRAFLDARGPSLGLARGAAPFVLARTHQGRGGRYLRFSQVHEGLPVLGGELIARVEGRAGAWVLTDLTLSQEEAEGTVTFSPGLSEGDALSRGAGEAGPARLRAPARARRALAPGRPPRAVWVVELPVTDPAADWQIILDAQNGQVLSKRDRSPRAEGEGLVFDPSPVASTNNTDLTDDNDQASPALNEARRAVLLPRLDGTGVLRGAFAEAQNPQDRAFSPSLVFRFARSDPRFEEVMAYFHLDRAQQRVQSLGFFDVNNRRQLANVNGIPDDNSFYSPFTKQLTFGTGGVDDAEDADIILHEYGHSIQDDQIPGFGTSDTARAMGEGFSDYLAGSFLDVLSPELSDPACIGDWDATSYDGRTPPCLRRLDERKHFPEFVINQIHADGEIWSGALFQARAQLGPDVMDTLVLEAHFLQATDEEFAGAFETLLATDDNLFGGIHREILARVFVEKGISRVLTPPADFTTVLETLPRVLNPPREDDGTYRAFEDHTNNISVPGAEGLRVNFERIETERDPACFLGACDSIYLYDRDGHLFQIVSGEQGPTTSVVIPGDFVRIRLVTDGTVSLFGYRTTTVDVMGATPPATCNNGALDPGEDCDGADLGASSCEALGFSGGALSCRSNCTLDTSDCAGGDQCGNGALDAGEQCDGALLGEQSCSDAGFTGGLLSCGPDCTLNTDRCTRCGDGLLDGAEACDGADLGGKSCDSIGLADGLLRCSGACTLDTSACLPAECRE